MERMSIAACEPTVLFPFLADVVVTERVNGRSGSLGVDVEVVAHNYLLGLVVVKQKSARVK
jgi:hypothetical protein